MKPVRALIVDGDDPARQELRHLLQSMGEVQVAGEATNIWDALTLIKSSGCDVVFCDIQLPGPGGIELARQLEQMEVHPCLIFSTAHPEYALEAFEVDAVDYLLKPVSPARLRQAVRKVLRFRDQVVPDDNHNGNRNHANLAKRYRRLGRLPVERQGKMLLVREDDIVYAYTSNDNVFIRTHDAVFNCRYTLRELEGRLQDPPFFRTHRCYIVNLSKVQEINPFFNGTFTLTVNDGQRTEIPVSRNQAKNLKSILGL